MWGNIHLLYILNNNIYAALVITCCPVPTHTLPALALSNLQSWALILQETVHVV